MEGTERGGQQETETGELGGSVVGERSTESFLLPLVTATTIMEGEIVIMAVVQWVGPAAFQLGSLGHCQ